jgi:hypothetical protein
MYDSGYVPMSIAPHGYSIWEYEGVYTSVLQADKICQMQVEDSVAYYAILHPNKTQEKQWHPIHIYEKYKQQEPTLCFLYVDRPSFIMRDVEDSSALFLYDETQDALKEFRFRLNYELLAYDCIYDQIFVYDSDYLYRLDSNTLVQLIRQNSEKIVLSKPVMTSVFESWTDMLAVENRVFFLDAKEMYEVAGGRERMVGYYGSDKFNHTVVPTFEHEDGIKAFESITINPEDFMLRPPTDGEPLPTEAKVQQSKARVQQSKVQAFAEYSLTVLYTLTLALVLIYCVVGGVYCVLNAGLQICEYCKRRSYSSV